MCVARYKMPSKLERLCFNYYSQFVRLELAGTKDAKRGIRTGLAIFAMSTQTTLYELSDPLSDRFFRGKVQFAHHVNPYDLLRGDIEPPDNLVLGRAAGRIVRDVVWTDDVSTVLISDRLVGLFRAHRFSGWSTYKVLLDAKEVHQKYFGLTVTGRCGPLDRTRGEWVHRDDVPGRFLRGVFFDEQSWDDADFFLPQGTAFIFITERVRDLLMREAAENIKCDRLSDVLTSERVIRSSRSRPN